MADLLGRYNFFKPQNLRLLVFKGARDGTGYHVGCKHGSSKHRIFVTHALTADYPVDGCAGTHLIFIYPDIIHYQVVGNKKNPCYESLIQIVD